MDTATLVEAVSAALVGLVALGTIVGWIIRQANQRQSEHIAEIVDRQLDVKLQPIKETVGEKNGNGDAMQMLARALGQNAEILRGQDRAAELERDLLELHTYTHDGVHRLNGQVGMMWRSWAKEHGYDPDVPPPPQPSPKDRE